MQPSSSVGGKLTQYQLEGLRPMVALYENIMNGILPMIMGSGKQSRLLHYYRIFRNMRGKVSLSA